MKTIVSNDIRIKDYTPELLKWCEENLVIDNPEFYSALRAGRYVGRIPRTIVLYETRYNELILPFGVIKHIFPMIKHSDIITDFANNGEVTFDGSIKLYDYQDKALKSLVAQKGGILQAPCGSGKTQIGLQLVKELKLKTLWITHTLDLINQAKTRAEQYFKCDIGVISEGRVNVGKDITFATVQTLSKLDLHRFKYEFDMVIVDECHKVAGSPTRLMMFYKVVTNLASRYKYGLSATLHRADKLIKSTYSVLGDISHIITEKEVGNKTIKAIHQKVELKSITSLDYLDTDGTLIYNKLIDYLCNNEQRNKDIAEVINKTNNYGLVLSHRVEHLYQLRRILGYGSILVGDTPKKEREAILQDARSGVVRLLLSTYSLAKEGLDIPILDRLYLTTPQKDYAIIRQSAGRIQRNVTNKQTPVIIDFVDTNIYYCVNAYKKRKAILKKEE
jgi:superfamily II DNA or RNA helicase